MSIEIVQRAQWDIEIVADELRERGGQRAAANFGLRLNRALTTLERFPNLGERIDPPFPNHPELRVMAVRQQPHRLVYFAPTPTGIRVLRVLHSSRDIELVFGSA